jgi:uncharacterized protein YkwD
MGKNVWRIKEKEGNHDVPITPPPGDAAAPTGPPRRSPMTWVSQQRDRLIQEMARLLACLEVRMPALKWGLTTHSGTASG